MHRRVHLLDASVLMLCGSVPAQHTPDPPLPALAPLLPPEPAQPHLWAGTVTYSVKYTANFQQENSTQKSVSGYSTREKRGSEELRLSITLRESELYLCQHQCNPVIGRLYYNRYQREQFIGETEELCRPGDKRFTKIDHIETQEQFTLGPDGQQGSLDGSLKYRDLEPSVAWDIFAKTWVLSLAARPTFMLRFYSKAEDLDCSGPHPGKPIQQLMAYRLALPNNVPLKNQAMTFQNTLAGSTSVPFPGLDGRDYQLRVEYNLHLIPTPKK